MNQTTRGRPAFGGSSTHHPRHQQPSVESTARAGSIQNFSPESEQVVLAFALLASSKDDASTFARASVRQQLLELLADADFYLEQHTAVWSIVRGLCESDRPADIASVVDAAVSRQLFIGGAPYLMSLVQNPSHRVASEKTILAAAHRIKNLSMLRQLDKLLASARATVTSGATFEMVVQPLQEDIKNLYNASSSSRPGARHVREFAIGIIDELMAAADGEKPTHNVTPSGFPSLDELIMGFADEDFIILASRPSMGKTSFALNLAENCATGGQKDVLFFSLEMTGAALTRRILARNSRVSMNALRRNELGDEDWSRISEGVEKLSNTGIYIDDTPGLTKEEIRSRGRAFKRDHPNCLIIIDYLQFVASDGRTDARVHAGEVSQGCKQMARELKAPVIALSQLNRNVEQRPNKRPGLSDLRDSGSLEQDADLIMFLYRDEYYNKESKDIGIAEVIVGKQREGATATIKMAYEGKMMTWADLGLTYTD